MGEAYYASAQEREIPGFTFGYLVAQRTGETIATVPYFVMDFKINTMLEDGWLKRWLGDAGFRMACIGHPCAAFGNIDGAVSEELMSQVFEELKQLAPVVSLKGFKPHMPALGFVEAKGLPVAILTLRENFWQSMSSVRRRNIRRKRKKPQPCALKYWRDCLMTIPISSTNFISRCLRDQRFNLNAWTFNILCRLRI